MLSQPHLTSIIDLILAGKKSVAQQQLESYLQTCPDDITAWLWFARALRTQQNRNQILSQER